MLRMPLMNKLNQKQIRPQDSRGLRYGYRSGLEDKCADKIKSFGHDVCYEQHKIKYVQPEKPRSYTPDFKITTKDGFFYIESKGRWTVEDRKKHLWIKEQHPALDIRLVFQNCNTKLYKGSPTTYADFCIKHNLVYACKEIPDEWLRE